MEQTIARTVHVTTSWDDGHPEDFRIAALLSKYDLPGTFYIPRTSTSRTMSEVQIRELASEFEIGAHTLRHVLLPSVNSSEAEREIIDSRAWLEDVLGKRCSMFCFPAGKFRDEHLAMVRRAGYLGARTVELLSTSVPARRNGILLMSTSIQAHPHQAGVYVRNATKRRAFKRLWWFVLNGSRREWPDLAEALWEEAWTNGGAWHLWGHSWEIDEHDQWQRLEQVFRFIHERRNSATFMTNSELCASVAP